MADKQKSVLSLHVICNIHVEKANGRLNKKPSSFSLTPLPMTMLWMAIAGENHHCHERNKKSLPPKEG